MPKAVGILWLIIWGDLGMSFEWPIKTLGEVCSKITDGAHHSPKSVAIGKPMASVKDLTRFGVDLSEARLISNEDFDFLVRQGCKPEIEDVLISKDGNSALDTVCNVKQPLDAVLLSSVAILRPNLLLITSDYLKYYLSSKDVIEYLKSNFISGAAIPRIVLKDFKKAEIQLPPLDIQNKITSILNPLDNRISLLRETNITLEAIAQTLFKSWFVDFDPVKAKAEGKQPEGMDEATAALFPSEFEESALGLIPKGWRVSSVNESFILTMGQSPSGSTYNESGDGLPFYQGRTDFGFRFPTQRIFCNAPTRFAEIGDTLVSVRAPVGDVNMALERCCIGRGVSSVRHPLGYRGFTFYSIKNLRSHFELFESEGTVFGSINKKDFQELPIIKPINNVLKAFDEIVSVMDDRITINEEKLRTLTTLRDTLLPRLISGQLRINQAQDVINEVGA